MEFETELRERLRTTADRAHVDLTELTDGSFRRGKRYVRQRRVAVALAATACAGAVVAAATWSGAGARPNVETDYARTTVATSSGQPAVEKAPITPQAALRILLAQLPSEGRTYSDFRGGPLTGKPGLDRAGAVWVKLVHTDAAGPSNLSLAVGSMPGEPPCEPASCVRTTKPDGSVLIVSRETGPNGKEMAWRAVYLRRGGFQIQLLEDNSAQWKGEATRPAPPFPTDLLERVVTSPAWQPKVDASLVQDAKRLFTPEPAR